ncbi:myxochelin B biosynthesis transaminase MxcL [Melittangium boletus]|uniref:Glutamate-1-semialdehyde aminotransferase n=1 Tax=Melittangium boletus DSM 14713 TaxID=1294270 RepID=A0A250IJT1_9BACT|nr:myxochelin B biosynthesis transaminase MxcL [Melittangium boletus]ATB31462.1 glutamate-1-semialdehyde aminotransferase [Melittangium boletus DSM 14713]
MDTHPSRHPSLPRPIVGPMQLSESNRLMAEAKKLVPGLTQTMMKKPEMFAPGAFPVYLARGQGALVEDVDGQQYIDFICGLGASSLGHNHPAVVDTIRQHLPEGLLHSLPTAWEVSAARTLVEMIPGGEQARFFKTGADATSAAVRLARIITGKEHLITVGYNGWHDHFMFDTPGVPAVLAQYTQRMPLFEEPDEAALLARIEQTGAQLAAVLLSVPFNRCLTRDFMHALRATCTKHGVLLIQDEVITGFRLARGGAQEFFDVRADFVCVSKALAAGMPLSAVVGPEKYLSRLADTQVSTTFGGELLSLAVCEAVLKETAKPGFIEHLADMGRRLATGINARAERVGSPLRVLGYDAIPLFRFSKNPVENAKLTQPFQAAMARRGILLRRDLNFICSAHTPEQIDYTVDMAEESMRECLGQGSATQAA